MYFIYSEFDESVVYGMMNIGSNPTFKDKKSSIEIHFFDFTKDLYDLDISVRIVSKIRNEIKISTINQNDIQQVNQKPNTQLPQKKHNDKTRKA